MLRLKKVFDHRFGPLAVVIAVVLILSFLTRLFLLAWSWPQLEANIVGIIGIFFIGLFYDLVVALFFCVPVALYCWLMKESWYCSKGGRIGLYLLFFIIFLILAVNVAAEIAFWEEFNVRFNFIAVDYLIYTTEVLGNIQESYNVPLILGAVLLAVVGLLIIFRRPLKASQQVVMRFPKRTIFFLAFLAIAVSGYFFMNNRWKNTTENNYINELGGNGIYEFGAAFWHNEIDYNRFYVVNDNRQNLQILRKLLQEPGVKFSSDPMSIEREILSDGPEHKWNVVLISVESLSGDYMKFFGGTDGITPNLDSLIPHSFFYKNFYASGTRTVRGLEALSLAIPPTPGQSVVRRPNNEEMFTIGNVLKEKGYDVRYMYGGNSFFDNMGYFFGHNGYNVIDKGDIPEERIIHETAWGAADEVAFDIALEASDESYKKGKLFFNHIMTVSNHKPYTYPEGRIDIHPTSQTKQGAVKYTDYAIARFLKDASRKPWFNNTIFVIVSDHCSSSAGKTDLPPNRYHIPCFIYSPALIKPGMEERFTSQIDLVPTILGLMNISYTSRFMGYDMNNLSPGKERVFISTYQDMGFLKGDTLVILSPQKKVSMFKTDIKTGASSPIGTDEKIKNEAISWYQGAGFLINNGDYKFKK